MNDDFHKKKIQKCCDGDAIVYSEKNASRKHNFVFQIMPDAYKVRLSYIRDNAINIVT